jgi:hypothetical protein
LYWSGNYSGDPQTAVWTEIDNVQWHDGITDWVWTFSEILDLSALTGTSAHIAFKYTSTSQQAAAWELDDIVLSYSDNNNTYNISASANPPTGGAIAGAGTYSYGETVELTATPESNYTFVNWTENENEVSSDATYSFTVTENRTLKANFTTTTDIHAPENEGLVISPNPAKDFIRINNKKNIDVQIFSPSGICVAEHNNINSNGLIDISDLNSGIYLVLLKTADNIICKKLIIK